MVLVASLFDCTRQESPCVARFGEQEISLQEFKIAYLEVIKQPDTFDSRELREQFLNELIRQRLLARAARRQQMQSDERLQYQLAAYRDKCLREAHFEKVIRPQIDIAENDVAEVYQFTQEQRRIQQLFVPQKSQADSLYQFLERGIEFDTLAQWLYSDSAQSPASGNLGWVNWDQLEYEMAMTAFRQPVHTYSKPIKSRFGYHIMRVLDFRKKPLITRQEYLAHQQKVKYLLEQKRGEALANEYIESMMASIPIQVYPAVLEFVGKQLAKQFRREPSIYDGMKTMQLSEQELGQIETGLWEQRQAVMATINGKDYTIGNFIGALNFIPYAALYQSYKTTLDLAFRDFVLTEEANARQLDRLPEVQLKIRRYEDYVLQLKLRRKLVREVQVQENEILAVYQGKKDSTFQNVSFEVARPFIEKQLLQEKKARRIPNFVDELKQGLKIEKYPQRIHDYYDKF